MGSFRQLLTPVLAFLGCLALISTFIAVLLTPTYLTTYGIYSTKQHAIYVTGTTILATLFTSFISSQIQKLLLYKLDSQLRQEVTHLGGSGLVPLTRRWQAILRIGKLVDRGRHLPIALPYIFTSLITTAIVATFSPGQTTRLFPYSLKIPHGYGPQQCPLIEDLLAVEQDGRDYYWNLGNGSALWYPTNACGPSRVAVTLSGDINTINPDAFAYADSGVAVHSSAIGAPFSVYAPENNTAPEFNALLREYGSSVVNTTQCVPVMVKNPISCRRGGTVILQQNNVMNITSDDNLCSYVTEFPFINTNTSSTMAQKMCAHDQVGQGTIVIGGTRAYAIWIAYALGDTTNVPQNNATYAVSCTVNTRDVFEYRMVTLSLQVLNVSGSSYVRVLESGPLCNSPILIVDDVYFATSAAANWQLLSQNRGLDGWFDTINQLTGPSGEGRGPPYAFNNSRNPLEDSLGLVAALATSRLNSSTPEAVLVEGTVAVTATRIGGGKIFALAYIIPPIVSAIVLLYLLFATWSIRNIQCSSSKLNDLIELGTRMDMGLRNL